MKKSLWMMSLLPALLVAPAALAAEAQVKVGTGVEKNEVVGAAESFTVAPNTRIYSWARVTGAEGSKVTFVFLKDGQEASKVEVNVPRSPYRTHAFKTIRAGDAGSWTVKVVGADGAELGSASFQVTLGS